MRFKIMLNKFEDFKLGTIVSYREYTGEVTEYNWLEESFEVTWNGDITPEIGFYFRKITYPGISGSHINKLTILGSK